MSYDNYVSVQVAKPMRVAALADAGLSAGRRGLHEPIRGVRIHPDIQHRVAVPRWADPDLCWWQLRDGLAYLQVVRPDAIGAGRTAAYLHGLPIDADPNLIEVAVREAAAKVVRQGFRSRRRTYYDPVPIAGVRVQRASNVLLELAATEPEHTLIAMVETLVGHWHGPPVGRLSQLTEIIEAKRGVSGRSRLLTVLEHSREGVRSPRETHLRLMIVAAGLPEPAVAPQVALSDGSVVHPDLAYMQARVALEYDGDHHRLSDTQFAYDIERYTELPMSGWLLLRVTKKMTDAWVIETLTRMLRARNAI